MGLISKDGCAGQRRRKMDEVIYVDASLPAPLFDGVREVQCPTLQEAVIAWDHLPFERRETATIRSLGNTYTAQEIPRLRRESPSDGGTLFYPSVPAGGSSTTADGAPPPTTDDTTSEQPNMPFTSRAAFPFTYDHSADIPARPYAAAQRNLAMQMSGSVEVFPPPQPRPEVSVPSEPTAGTAPSEISNAPPEHMLLEGMMAPVVTHPTAALEGTTGVSGTSSMKANAILVTNSERLHAEMLRRVEALEEAMVTIPARGIGDNNPPEPLEPEFLSEAELRGMRLAFAVLKAQQAAPQVPPKEAVEAVGFLAAIAERFSPVASYLCKQTDVFVTEATKELAKRVVQSPFWLTLIEQLPQLTDTAQHWLRSLGAH
jgi:hypothetical protein